jgi:hypothetical protein
VHALALIGVAVFVIVKRRSRPGHVCQFCGARTIPFDRVGPDEKPDILDYFRTREQREPDVGGVTVCMACRTVYDDFTQARAAPGPDSPARVTYCKVCGRLLRFHEPADPYIRCLQCRTDYEWRVHEASGFRFLMPPKGTSILPRARGRSLGGS